MSEPDLTIEVMQGALRPVPSAGALLIELEATLPAPGTVPPLGEPISGEGLLLPSDFAGSAFVLATSSHAVGTVVDSQRPRWLARLQQLMNQGLCAPVDFIFMGREDTWGRPSGAALLVATVTLPPDVTATAWDTPPRRLSAPERSAAIDDFTAALNDARIWPAGIDARRQQCAAITSTATPLLAHSYSEPQAIGDPIDWDQAPSILAGLLASVEAAYLADELQESDQALVHAIEQVEVWLAGEQ